MTSTADAERVLVWVEPYTKGQDQLSVLKNDFEHVISGNFSVNTGILEFTRKGDRELTNQDWNAVLNYPTYRLFINVSVFLSVCLCWYCVYLHNSAETCSSKHSTNIVSPCSFFLLCISMHISFLHFTVFVSPVLQPLH